MFSGLHIEMAKLKLLVDWLESDLLEESMSNGAPTTNATILDVAAVVEMLNPSASRTFQECGESVFASYILAEREKSDRIDLVWDVYQPASLKASTREKRGKGTRKRVSPSTKIPKNWSDLLRVDENKTELFAFLSHVVVRLSVGEGKEIYATK